MDNRKNEDAKVNMAEKMKKFKLTKRPTPKKIDWLKLVSKDPSKEKTAMLK